VSAEEDGDDRPFFGRLRKAIDRLIGQPDRAHEESAIGWDSGPDGRPNIVGETDLGGRAKSPESAGSSSGGRVDDRTSDGRTPDSSESGRLRKAIERPIGQPDRAREEEPIGWDFGPDGPPDIIGGTDHGAPPQSEDLSDFSWGGRIEDRADEGRTPYSSESESGTVGGRQGSANAGNDAGAGVGPSIGRLDPSAHYGSSGAAQPASQVPPHASVGPSFVAAQRGGGGGGGGGGGAHLDQHSPTDTQTPQTSLPIDTHPPPTQTSPPTDTQTPPTQTSPPTDTQTPPTQTSPPTDTQTPPGGGDQTTPGGDGQHTAPGGDGQTQPGGQGDNQGNQGNQGNEDYPAAAKQPATATTRAIKTIRGTKTAVDNR